jgi:hypothetical protein
VLLLGGFGLGGIGVQSSISAYYYTVMGGVFVGSLCAQGVLLIVDRYSNGNSGLAVVTGTLVIAVALLPTAPVGPTPGQSVVGVIHLVCATAYYLTLAYFAYFIFTRPLVPGQALTGGEKRRNSVYRLCGVVVVLCLVLVPVTGLLFPGRLTDIHPLFWLETVAGIAFGTSWLIRGGWVINRD